MRGEIEKFHTCGQNIWVKRWIDGRTIFCIGPPGQRIWVEHCPKWGEKFSLKDLRDGEGWKWELGKPKKHLGIVNMWFSYK